MFLTIAANQIFSSLTLLSHFFILFVLVIIVFYKNDSSAKFLKFLAKNVIIFSLIVVLGSVFGSLFYSEIIGYSPCKLCWLQRIFMYPQIILLGLALYKKDNGIIDYALWLSVIGFFIAVYHYFLQMGISLPVPCFATSEIISCSHRYIMKFGYITESMMSLTAFVLLIIFAVVFKIFGEKQFINK
ncbi:MAG: disulfide bond formation protein B [Patescibacteria group bacterium]